MRATLATLTLVLAFCAGSFAQVLLLPNPQPLVTAETTTWFQLGDPITFSGSFYYPAGPRVFFDGNVMVRVGDYRGVPLYADATIEPFSIVLVPAGGGLMQPYERRRVEDLAGTTGSRAPSFPVGASSGARLDRFSQEAIVRGADFVDAAPAVPLGSLGRRAPSSVARATPPVPVRLLPRRPVATTGQAPAARPGTSGVWVPFAGERWIARGAAMPFVPGEFEIAGEHHGFPVFRRAGDPATIYIATIEREPQPGDLLTPYSRSR
jgi:hypothetical protein